MPPEFNREDKRGDNIEICFRLSGGGGVSIPGERSGIMTEDQSNSWQELLEISRKWKRLTRVCRQRSPVPIFMEKRA